MVALEKCKQPDFTCYIYSSGQRLLTEQLVGAGDRGIPFTNPHHIRPAPRPAHTPNRAWHPHGAGEGGQEASFSALTCLQG